MSKYIIGLLMALSALLSACSEDTSSSCTQRVTGCTTDYPFSCPGASFCYNSIDVCESSGECP